MSWQILIGISVILASINSLLHRGLLKNEGSDAYAQSVVFTFLVGIFSLIILKVSGRHLSVLQWEQLPIFIAIALLSPLVFIFMFKGFKLIGASEHTMLLTSSRIWAILGAILFLKETPTITKLMGALLIIFGVILTEWKKERLKLNNGAIYVLLAAFFIAVAQTLAYFLLRNFDVLSFMVYNSLTATVLLLIFKPKIVRKFNFYFKIKNLINILFSSLNDGLANIFTFLAYQIGRNALQIGPLGATQIPLTVILAIIFLGERERLNQKIVGSLAALAGSVLLMK
jgi:drug/metabolite transporter (DMT)-like permease